jgi:hypothetical protein
MNGYLCYFTMPVFGGVNMDLDADETVLELEVHTVSDRPSEEALERMGAFVGGFWLTEALELCTGADADKKYWIPPSAIQMMEIFDRPDPDELELDNTGDTI